MSKKIAILSAAGLIVLSETALRMTTGLGSPLLYRASASGYEIVPDQRITWFGHKLTYDANGFRVADPAQPYRDLRILTLGDSITNGGSEISDDQTYPLRLEQYLRDAEIEVSVLNPSAGGWAIGDEARWLQAHGLFGAQLVYLQIGENDFFQAPSRGEVLDAHPLFPAHRPASALFELWTRYIVPKIAAEVATSLDPGATASPINPAIKRDVFQALDTIKDYVQTHGASLSLIYIEGKVPDARPETRRAALDLQEWAAARAVPLIDVTPMLKASTALVYRDMVHPNAEGNAIIAEAVARDARQRLKKYE